LYSIDQQLYNANYQQSIANLQVQETNLLKAQKDADRYHELDKQDAIAKQQVDYADAALEAAKKQVDAAKANVNAVRANVNFATILAPFHWHDRHITGKKWHICGGRPDGVKYYFNG
jgi:membrane fusion protein (multidrug efflux system)